ncbi:MAG TPA: dihydrofolate reductase family protein, partial [Azospira sp.]|nr:dihydrofolate reductase family protein [Azospira sp.]
LEIDPSARVLQGERVLVVAAVENHLLASIIEARGAEVIFLPNDAGKVDLQALMRELAKRGINELHVEAGFKLNGSLLREGLVDELVLYLAPSLLGDASRGLFHLPALEDLAEKRTLQWRDVRQVGGDLRVVARLT